MIKKQFFPEATLKALATNNTVYNRGLSMYRDGRVLGHRTDSEQQVIRLEVNGFNSDYTVQISFLKNGVARRYHCTCPAFEKYSGACKHVIASMEYLNGINDNSPDEASRTHDENIEDRQSSLLNQVKTQFEKLQASDFSPLRRERVYIEFILNLSPYYYEDQFELFLKVGIKHMYVIKNVPEVFQAILNNDQYEFGKNLTYDYKDHFIAPEDRKVLELLATIDRHNRQYNTRDYSYTNRTEFNIPTSHVGELLSLLQDVDYGYMRFGAPPRHLSSVDALEPVRYSNTIDDFPVYFNLTKRGNRHYFSVHGIEIAYKSFETFNNSSIIKIDNHFYDLTQEAYDVFITIMELFMEIQNQEISFKQAEVTEFMSAIYPTLSRYFTVELDEDIKKTIYEEDLTAELYVDYKNQQLVLEPKFKYGNLDLNPLDDQVSNSIHDLILVRDNYKEANLLDQLYSQLGEVELVEGKLLISDFESLSYVVYEGLSQLFETFDLYLTDAVRKLYYQADNRQPISIDVDHESNLLHVDFDLADVSDEDLQQIVKQLRSGNSRFYKLSSGAILDLNKEAFEQVKDVADDLTLNDDNLSQSFQVPLYQGLSLLENNNVEKSQSFIQLAKSLLEPKAVSYEVPDQVQADLRPYQQTGYNWLKTLDAYQFGGVLADDMGLGKTLQSITFIQSKVNDSGGKYLIVCPSSVLFNWKYEFDKFAPEIQPTIINGNVDERQVLLDQLNQAESGVWITSYPLIQRDSEAYETVQFETIILDESQTVKNDAAKTTRAVSKLKAKNKFALSGTPIENNLNELWTLFSIVQPGMFKDKKHFKHLDTDIIASKIKPFILRRLKGQVLDDLPDKTETTEYIELSEGQKRLYQTQLALIQKEVRDLIDNDTFKQNSMQVLAGMTRLRQICCDPNLVTNQYEGESAKLERLMEYLAEAKQNGKRVVLFSQFTQMLAIIRERLAEEDYDYFYLDGQTKNKDRLTLTQRFNEGDKDLFLISLKAGGTGINLTGGDTVILYDSWWNPAIEDQAADRVHRFGQKNHVQVLRMIARGTIEERINELQAKKRDLVDSVIDSQSNQSITSLSKDDILNLLEI